MKETQIEQEKTELDNGKEHDELIEEYERKINKTIQLLEEEKKKNQNMRLKDAGIMS